MSDAGAVQVPLVTTRCGYCGGLLAPTILSGLMRLTYECPICAPVLRSIRTAEEWIAWARKQRLSDGAFATARAAQIRESVAASDTTEGSPIG